MKKEKIIQHIKRQLELLDKKVNKLEILNNPEWTNILQKMKKNDIVAITVTDILKENLNNNNTELFKIKSLLINTMKKNNINYIPKNKKNFYILDYKMIPVELKLKKNKKYSIIIIKKLNNNKFDFSKLFEDYFIKVI